MGNPSTRFRIGSKANFGITAFSMAIRTLFYCVKYCKLICNKLNVK